MAHQHVAHLVGKERVRAAAERCHLDKLDAFLPGTPLRRLQNSVGVSPLRQVVRVVYGHLAAPYDVVGKHVDAHVGQHVRHLVLYQHVGMVRPSGQHYCHGSAFPGLAQHVFVVGGDVFRVSVLRADGQAEGAAGRLVAYPQRGKILATLPVKQLPVLETDGWRVDGYASALYALDDFGVTGHDGTVVTVLSAVLPLVDNERHEDAVYAAVDEVLDVAVREFGRETDVVRHHHARALLVI